MQDRPICFDCHETIEHSPVFEAPCGHEDCASAVFHGLCLMQYRDKRESADDRFELVGFLVRKKWSEEHTQTEREQE